MSDVTICRACGLPRFHGPAGYAGAQCLCQWRGATLPQMYDELMAKNAALEAENARLIAMLEDLEADITALQEKLAALDIQIRKRTSFAKLIESTLHIHWIDNPEVLEATWLQNEDWLKEHH